MYLQCTHLGLFAMLLRSSFAWAIWLREQTQENKEMGP